VIGPPLKVSLKVAEPLPWEWWFMTSDDDPRGMETMESTHSLICTSCHIIDHSFCLKWKDEIENIIHNELQNPTIMTVISFIEEEPTWIKLKS
jgi:hypothetical protein